MWHPTFFMCRHQSENGMKGKLRGWNSKEKKVKQRTFTQLLGQLLTVVSDWFSLLGHFKALMPVITQFDWSVRGRYFPVMPARYCPCL